MDVNKVRQDFPLLRDASNKKAVIYFDNACQSLRPKTVIEKIQNYYDLYPACAGRSAHHLAAQVTQECQQARNILAKFLHAKRPEEIVFTRNTTEGINLVAHSLPLKSGDIVLISDKEHNSNLIPWQMLVKHKGVDLKIIPTLPDGRLDLDAYVKMLDPQVKLVSIGFTSNLDGLTIDSEAVIINAHRNGSLVLLDAAQAAPHQKIDVKALDVDFLAISGHKMLGPSGTGVLYGKYALLDQIDPFMVGGDTVEVSTYDSCQFLPPPAKFEAGLQDYAGIIGLGAAARYLQDIGFNDIQRQELLLNEFITSEILQIQGLHLIGSPDAKRRGGIISFHIDGIDSHKIALMLDQMAGILVRSGQHCVHSWFNSRKIYGAVRASVYFYNTLEEAVQFVVNLKKIRKVL